MTARPLSPGAQELSLSAQTPGAATPQKSATTLAVIVPESAAQPPVAVALPQGEGDAARPMGALGPRAPRHVALDMVEYDASGKTILSGRADPGASVEIFIGKQAIGTVKSAADGVWSLALDAGVPIGVYHLRLVSRGADGKREETELDLRRASPGELGGGDYLAVVPGNNLWHLARRSYGDGLRYVEIYRANRSEIADPNLIYPNQLLSLPGKS
jgi:nucleoid-associated protein YgaU